MWIVLTDQGQIQQLVALKLAVGVSSVERWTNRVISGFHTDFGSRSISNTRQAITWIWLLFQWFTVGKWIGIFGAAYGDAAMSIEQQDNCITMGPKPQQFWYWSNNFGCNIVLHWSIRTLQSCSNDELVEACRAPFILLRWLNAFCFVIAVEPLWSWEPTTTNQVCSMGRELDSEDWGRSCRVTLPLVTTEPFVYGAKVIEISNNGSHKWYSISGALKNDKSSSQS